MGKLRFKIKSTDRIRGYKCALCGGTLIGTEKKDPRIVYLGKKTKRLKICRGCLEKLRK